MDGRGPRGEEAPPPPMSRGIPAGATAANKAHAEKLNGHALPAAGTLAERLDAIEAMLLREGGPTQSSSRFYVEVGAGHDSNVVPLTGTR